MVTSLLRHSGVHIDKWKITTAQNNTRIQNELVPSSYTEEILDCAWTIRKHVQVCLTKRNKTNI